MLQTKLTCLDAILICIVALTVVLAAPGCQNKVQISRIVDQVYRGEMQRIRRGIPPNVISHQFNLAFESIGRVECICEGTGEETNISSACINEVFSKLDTSNLLFLRVIDEMIVHDKGSIAEMRLFPFYDSEVNLRSLSNYFPPGAEAYLAKTAAAVYSAISESGRPKSVFASFEATLYDPKREEVCDGYEMASATIPADSYVAYLFGVAAQMRFKAVSKTSILTILGEAFAETFLAARCQRKSGHKLRVPMSSLKRVSLQASTLTSVTSSDQPLFRFLSSLSSFDKYETVPAISSESLPAITDVAKVIQFPFHFFREEIETLSSLEGYGRVYIADYNNKKLVSVLEILSRISKSVYEGAVGSGGHTTMGGEDDGNEDNQCTTDWRFMTRLCAVSHYGENCCPHNCYSGNTDPVAGMFETEDCCFACNAYICEGNDSGGTHSVDEYGADADDGGGWQIVMV